MKKLLMVITAVLSAIVVYAQNTQSCGTVTDFEGNIYKTVQIGSQCWMAENLKTKHYANGKSINKGLNYAEGEIGNINESSNMAYWYYPNGDVSFMPDYGLLYNWAAVMGGAPSSSRNPSGVQGICPNGWHVPSVAEWEQLMDYVGSQKQYRCGASHNHVAKSLAATFGWKSCTDNCAPGNNPSTNNSTGFNALPAGYFSKKSGYGVGAAEFWTATQQNSTNSHMKLLYYYYYGIDDWLEDKCNGFSVRCVRN